MKASFILHLDSLNILTQLTEEQSGKLFKALYQYQLDKTEPDEFWLKIAFAPFKAQFERDNVKYLVICERNKQNSIKGGRPKLVKNPENPVGLFGSQTVPKNLDSDNDSDSDSGNNINILFNQFWSAFDKKIDKDKCRKVWTKLGQNKKVDLANIIESAKIYKTLCPDSKYQKNPLTWLNGKCWEDEIQTKINSKYIPTL
jgi:hypothetical protein